MRAAGARRMFHCRVMVMARLVVPTRLVMPARLVVSVRLVSRLLRLVAALALLSAILPVATAARAQTEFDRPGGDYQQRDVNSGDPQVCAQRCERDRKCRAWSFSYPSGSERAVCWLKDRVPARIEMAGVISGVRGSTIVEQRDTTIEMSTDRFGGDYRNFEVKAEDVKSNDRGEVCRAACDGDKQCRAWTYVRAGYMGAAPRCFLKFRKSSRRAASRAAFPASSDRA